MAATKTNTVTVVQPDFFGGPPKAVGVVIVAPEAPRPKRKVRHTQVAAHRELGPKVPTVDERCRWEVAGNGHFGRTRQEIADRTDMKLQTVCGAVNRLIKQGKLFEPVVGFDRQQRPVHYTRDGRNVVVAALHQDFDWLSFGQRTGKVA